MVNLEDLGNDKLGILAATEIMGYTKRARTFRGWNPDTHQGWERTADCWFDGKGGMQFQERAWNPAALGNEHQAMMVVGKLRTEGWSWKGEWYTDWADWESGPKCRSTFIREGDWYFETVLADTFGRAIVLAALKAKEVDSEPS